MKLSLIAFPLFSLLALHLAVAILTFTIGSTLSALQKAPKLTASEKKVCLTQPKVSADQDFVRRHLAIDKAEHPQTIIFHEAHPKPLEPCAPICQV